MRQLLPTFFVVVVPVSGGRKERDVEATPSSLIMSVPGEGEQPLLGVQIL